MNRPAHARFGQIQAIRGRRKALGFRDLHEDLQLVKIFHVVPAQQQCIAIRRIVSISNQP
jgi:hypothetical protein